MSDLEARIAEVLGAHQLHGLSEGVGTECVCGWESPSRGIDREAHGTHVAAMLAPVIREREAEALETFGHMYLSPEQDENYNKTAQAGRGYYRALIETRAKRIRSNDV